MGLNIPHKSDPLPHMAISVYDFEYNVGHSYVRSY